MDGIQSPAQEAGAATAFGLCATGGLAWVVAAALAEQGQPLTDRQFCAVLRQSAAVLPCAMACGGRSWGPSIACCRISASRTRKRKGSSAAPGG